MPRKKAPKVSTPSKENAELLKKLQKELKEVQDLKEELTKQVGDVKRVSQDVFLSPGTSTNDRDRLEDKKQRMKEHLVTQTKVSIFIPLDKNEKPGEAFLPVTLNGYRYFIEKGKPQQVPQQVHDVAMNHLYNTQVALENPKYNISQADDDKRQALV